MICSELDNYLHFFAVVSYKEGIEASVQPYVRLVTFNYFLFIKPVSFTIFLIVQVGQYLNLDISFHGFN